MEIELRNVGIIRSAHLQFIQGLNLIVGASSSGKSTLLRAIRSMMDNSFSDSNISYGQKKLAVRMKYNDHSATYIRDLDNTSRKSAYQVDGKVYTKIGRTSLDDLSSLFKLSPIEIDGEKINFNFSAQFSGPFLLLGSASLLYSILTYRSTFDITKMNDLYATDLKNVKKEIDVLVKTKNTLDKEREKKELELFKFQSVPEIYTRVQVLKNQNEEYNRIKNLYNSLRQAEEQRESSIKKIESLGKILIKLSYYSVEFSRYSALYNYTSSLNNIQTLTTRVQKMFDTLIKIESSLSIKESVQILSLYIQSTQRYTNNKSILKSIHIPTFESLQLLNNYLFRVEDRKNIITNIEAVRRSIQEINSRIKEVGVCPLCQQPLCNC